MTFKALVKQLYNILPFKKECYCLLKKIWLPPESLYRHLTFKKPFNVKVSDSKQFQLIHTGNIEENEIFWNGLFNGWEKKSITLWVQLCKQSKVILDIGANTGLYGLVAKTISPSAEVHCIEPIPYVFNILEKNISINHFDIQSHCIGLSDYNGAAKIYLPKGEDFAYSVTINQNTITSKETKELEINVCKLSTLIETRHISKIDLMKLDVETHEVEVIKGMENYLKEFKPAILIEVLNDDIAKNLNEIFQGMGYLYFNIDDIKNTVRLVPEITKSDYWNFLLCNENTAKVLNLI